MTQSKHQLFQAVLCCCAMSWRLLVAASLVAAAHGQSKRPPPANRTFVSKYIDEMIDKLTARMREKDPVIADMFGNCLPNTLDTTVLFHDIHAMWLRDSTNQVLPYIRFVDKDPALDVMLQGLVRRQTKSVLIDSFANAFNFDGSKPSPWASDIRHPNMTNAVYEGKYEMDSLAAFLKLSRSYWRHSNNSAIFDGRWQRAVRKVISTIRVMQAGIDEYASNPPYKFQRDTYAPTDTLILYGLGPPGASCGLSRSPFRPSDDSTLLPFLVPANAMAAVELRHVALMCREIGCEDTLTLSLGSLAEELSSAVHLHASSAEGFAYEVDCYGNSVYMDDANVPSLLSLPYLGFVDPTDPKYLITRQRVLSGKNPYFFRGSGGEGVGGPHVGYGYIWPMSIAMRALTSTTELEVQWCLDMLKATTNSTGFMHESFWKDDPGKFTRPWFAWANSLFGELILMVADRFPGLIFKAEESA
eukprot:s2934_g7.t1